MEEIDNSIKRGDILDIKGKGTTGPTGQTGFTGFTGATGSTGHNYWVAMGALLV